MTPKGVYILGMHLCEAGELDLALTALDVAVRGGFHCPSSMRTDPQWSGATGSPEFVRLLAVVDARHQWAREAFEAADGPEILAQHA